MYARIQSVDSAAVAGGAVGAIAAAVKPDAFFYFLTILAFLTLADWGFGRRVARSNGTYSRRISRNGMVGKAAELVVLLSLRSLEYAISLTGLPSTLGLVSAALALALIVDEMESIERHKVSLSGSGIPGLSAVLVRVRALTGGDQRVDGGQPPPTGDRRKSDDPEDGV